MSLMNDTNPVLTIRAPLFGNPFATSLALARAWFERAYPADTPQPVYVTVRRIP